MQRVTGLFEQYVKLCQSLNYETMIAAVRNDDPAKLTDTIAANLQLSIEEKQELLEIFDPAERLNRIGDVLDVEIEKLNMDRTIQSRVKRQMERAQKEYYLNEKIKAIQKELGRGEKSEFDELKKKVDAAGMPREVHEKALQELKKLEAMPPMSAESTVSRNYLDWLLAVPWKKRSKEIRDIDIAEKTLNEDHYGLEKIKERILEFLAVRQLVKNPKGSILCFVGPPGVGKTSLGMSIAKATGRKFVRMSLGGVRDEAEVRGHRRTYIGALPGQIIQMMKKAGTKNPGLHARRSGQDVDGLPRRSFGGAAGSARSRAELHVRRSLSRRGVRPVAGVLHRHRQRAAHHSRGVAGPHGSAPAARLHRAGEGGDRQAVPGAQTAAADRPDRREHHLHRRCAHRDHSPLHARSRRPQPGARDRQHLPQGRAQSGEGGRQASRSPSRPRTWPSTWA